MLLTFVLHVKDVSCELYCGCSLACTGYWSLQVLAKFNQNIRESLVPRLGRALWKGCCWLPVVTVFHYCLWVLFFSTKEKLMWIHCDLLGRIVFAITTHSVLLENNHFPACVLYHRKYAESCLQHQWLKWVYYSRKRAETNQQKNITTYFATWNQCSSINLFPNHATLFRHSFDLPSISCCLHLLLW